MKFLEGLNDKQKEAATHTKGPLLIIAGAGAGKTKTIIARINYLIAQGHDPKKILAVTFTNKAGQEMRDRLNINENTSPWSNKDDNPFVSTFHTLGVFILKNHADKLNYKKHFSILDRDDSLKKIKEAMIKSGVDPKQFEPKKILSTISAYKGQGLSAQDLTNSGENEFRKQIISRVWQHYQNILFENNAFDFDDLLLKPVDLFHRYPLILKEYQDRWQYIHIDEYQDTNHVQYRLAKMLAQNHKNICVVGDIDQSIYSWRGADYTNILNFEKDYPESKTVLLEENYRSTENILKAANQIIQKNKNRREKNLFTNNGSGEPLKIYVSGDETEEAEFIATTAKNLIAGGSNPGSMAVLYRANFQSRILEEAFLKLNVPYQVLGIRFFERKEIKDVLAYLKTSLNRQDLMSFTRIVNTPKRGIGKVTLAKIVSGQEEKLPQKMQQKIKSLNNLLNDIKTKIETNNQPTSNIVKYTIEASGMWSEYKQEGTEEALERLENLKELVTLATKYDHLSGGEGISELLTESSLVSDQDNIEEKKSAVRLMTVHASKGLEFDTVFISGLEEKLFPHEPAFATEDRDEEEERRLFYVALTRARKKLFLSYAQTRKIYGTTQINLPSEFLLDLSDEYTETINRETFFQDDLTYDYD